MYAHKKEKKLMLWPYALYVGWDCARNISYARRWSYGKEDTPSPRRR
jgi:hypothetical protein